MTTASDNIALTAYEGVLGFIRQTFKPIFGTSASNLVVGTPGNDVIVGLPGQELIGGDGNNALLGGAGDQVLFSSTDPSNLNPQVHAAGVGTIFNFNYLSGGPGDVLVGGPATINLFVFASGSGQNLVQDFVPQKDALLIQSNIDGSGINSFQSLQPDISQGASGAVVNFGHGDTVTLQGISAAQLGPQNIAFSP